MTITPSAERTMSDTTTTTPPAMIHCAELEPAAVLPFVELDWATAWDPFGPTGYLHKMAPVAGLAALVPLELLAVDALEMAA